MMVHQYQRAPPRPMARALEVFEGQFVYPLGEDHSFRISHGEDYPRFFRAIGETACFVAEANGRVLGTLGAMIRNLLLPSGEETTVAYLADLKVSSGTNRGRVLYQLMRAARDWMENRVSAAFGVVMDGTPVTPQRYTGRLGFPAFQQLGQVVILRVPVEPDDTDASNDTAASNAVEVDATVGERCYRQLSQGRYGALGGNPGERSRIEPSWFCLSNHEACGRLEDTYKAKRLIDSTEREMKSAHLSCFAYGAVVSGAQLVRGALVRARQWGFPTLYVTVSPPDVPQMTRELDMHQIVLAPATIYGTGIATGCNWNINSAEI